MLKSLTALAATTMLTFSALGGVGDAGSDSSSLRPSEIARLQPEGTRPLDAQPQDAIFHDCYGETRRIHGSRNFVSVHSRTYCPGASKRTSTNLTRHRWYGWEQLANGGSTGNKESNVKWYCKGSGTYDYKATGYHRAIRNGRVGIALTATYRRLSC